MSDLRQAASFAMTTLQGWSNHDHWLWPQSALAQAKQNTTEAISLLEVALAEPEPEGPTDEELLRTYGLAKRNHNYEGPIDDWPRRAERAATVAGLRAVLASYGNYPGSPDSSTLLS